MGIIPKSHENTVMTPAVRKSKQTIIFRLFKRSASTPPKSDNTIMGKKEQAVTMPNKVDEPVSFNKYNGKEKRRIALPNSDTI